MEEQGSVQSFTSTCSSSVDPEEVAGILEKIRGSEEVEKNLNFMMSNVDISFVLFKSHVSYPRHWQVVDRRVRDSCTG